jgi:hypothetical protein
LDQVQDTLGGQNAGFRRLVYTCRSSRQEFDSPKRFNAVGWDAYDAFEAVKVFCQDIFESRAHRGASLAGANHKDSAGPVDRVRNAQVGKRLAHERLRTDSVQGRHPDRLGVVSELGNVPGAIVHSTDLVVQTPMDRL